MSITAKLPARLISANSFGGTNFRNKYLGALKIERQGKNCGISIL